MALLDTKEYQFGVQNVWATTVGVADLPSTNTSGVIQLGDQVINLSGAIGAPAYWVCTTAGSSPAWSAVGTTGGAVAARTAAGSTTLLSTDRYVFVSAAGTVTLPAPSTALAAHIYTVKALAQPVTLTAASGGNLDGTTLGSAVIETNQTVDLFTNGLTQWYSIGRDFQQNTRTVAGNTTLLNTDRFVFISAAGTVTLPAPTAMSAGLPVVVKATAQPVTLTAASGANLDGTTLGSAVIELNQSFTVTSDGLTNWYSVGRDFQQQVRTASPPATLSVTDRIVLSGAGALTLPAPAGYSVGYPFVVHATAASVTITPASGNINGAAAVTLGANANAQIFCDGTNFFTMN